MIVDRMVRALDDRLRVVPLARRALVKVFPDHWSFMLGEVALYSFVALVLTGVYLTFFFEPSTAERVYSGAYEPLSGSRVSSAYASTVELSFDVRSGLLIRQTHHWAALVFVGAIVLHLLRIFFTGAFRRPREINWLIGVTMLALALLNGFTGYSIPDDLLSGTGLRIIYSVVESIPVVGTWVAFLAFGGEFPTGQMIPRMFITHVLVVPAVLVALISVHLAILVRQKHSQFAGTGRTEHNVVGSRFWPSYTLRTLALLAWVLAVLFALGGLVQINPVWIYGPFDPAQATAPAQPDWYVAWGDGALRLFPPVEFRIAGYLVPAPFLPGVVLGGLTFAGLYAWPFLERWRGRDHAVHQLLDRPRDHPVRLAVGVAVLVFYALLVFAAADDIAARLLGVPLLDVVSVLRILVLVAPPVAGVSAYLAASALRRAAPRAKSGDGRVELWADPDGVWRWGYRESSRRRLAGNRGFRSQEEAAAAAGTAYPGQPVVVVSPPPEAVGPGAVSRVAGRLGRTTGYLALLVIGAIRWRRGRPRQ
ncbi:cytochrome bc1 complex cytochrome b subunit [Micromonospora sp. NPDC003197]